MIKCIIIELSYTLQIIFCFVVVVGIHTWIRKQKIDILPSINIIFETKEIFKTFTDNAISNHEIKTKEAFIVFTDNAMLYQGILRYARDYI